MPKVVLVIEDDHVISRMYRLKFEAEGFTVEIAENGERGLTLIKNTQPDIVLLDIMMPTMSGDEMLERLRATPWGKEVKVIMLTNMGEQEIPTRFKELGVIGIIQKVEMTPRQVADLVKKKLESPVTE
jgi:DNA-binding response OmpR family regulator